MRSAVLLALACAALAEPVDETILRARHAQEFQGDLPLAIELYTRALRNKSLDAGGQALLHLRLARCHAELRQYETARAHLRESLFERAEVPVRFVEIGSWRLETLGDLAELRAGLHHTLTGTPLPPDRHLDAAPERIVLVASELATNALRHGMPPARLRLLSDGREFVVDVVDHSPDDPPVIGGHRPPGAGGFGLLLARRAARS